MLPFLGGRLFRYSPILIRRWKSVRSEQLIRSFGTCLIRGCSSGWLERTPDKREVGGSIPPSPTHCQAGL